MWRYIERLLDTQMLSPHGICLLWRPELLWTHVVSDVLIFGAYMTIPVALAVILRKRTDVPFGWVIWCFALFITACGFTHLMGVWTLWHPDYGVEALVKVVTALASIGTAIALWWLIPVAVAIPSPAQLRAVNAELRQIIAERDLAIEELEQERAERARSEEALLQSRKMDALGQLTGGIAHDFNNLLQAVQGSLELIRRRANDVASVQQLATNGIEAAERGGKLTSQLLAFARTRQVKLEPLAVSEVMLSSHDLLAGAAGNLVELRFDFSDEDLRVAADRTQLELAALNLVLNARDAMPDGGVVTVKADRLDMILPDPDLGPGSYVRLSVTDNGPGMSVETRSHAFEPFFTTKPLGQGTGLGLAQVYGAAKQAGGTARIESRPGVGTTVSVLLPAVRAHSEARAERASEPPPIPRLDGRVLLVDDDPRIRTFAAEALRDMGLDVIEASDGAEAVALFASTAPDLLLMDFAMPKLNGAEAARRIRLLRPGAPIIFMTGYADAEKLSSAMGSGVAALRKPFRIEDLAAELKRALAAERLKNRSI
jgi:signal transduction histidine kinase/ActR/RegA family two-component response regulator